MGVVVATVDRELLRLIEEVRGGWSDSGSSSASVPQEDVRVGSPDSAPSDTASLPRKDRFNLSTSRLWNLLREDCDPDLGGDEEVDLLGDCKLDWEAREDALEYCLEDIAIGMERCAGDPTMKSLPGDVDRLGPSDFEHSEILRLLQDWGFEHSELRRERLDL
ncbi:hypothetical protein C0J52_02052 [Blattella germanica]|nr:hypothetical protein C0J52_02052 [Blattella germanica]